MNVHHPSSDWRCLVVFRFWNFLRAWCFALSVLLLVTGANAADKKLKVLVVTGGHGFETNQFFRVFAENPEITFTDAIQSRASSTVYDREDLLNYDCIVLYDMVQNITEAQKAKFLSLFDKGIG